MIASVSLTLNITYIWWPQISILNSDLFPELQSHIASSLFGISPYMTNRSSQVPNESVSHIPLAHLQCSSHWLSHFSKWQLQSFRKKKKKIESFFSFFQIHILLNSRSHCKNITRSQPFPPTSNAPTLVQDTIPFTLDYFKSLVMIPLVPLLLFYGRLSTQKSDPEISTKHWTDSIILLHTRQWLPISRRRNPRSSQ